MGIADDRTQIGYTIVGPMESLCTGCAPTADEARRIYEDKPRWVVDVWPLYAGEFEPMDEIRCTECDRLLAH